MLKPITLQDVSKQANNHFWEIHALLMSSILMVEKLDENDEWITELGSLLQMASMKLIDMQGCFNKHIPRNVAKVVEVAHGQ